MSPDMCLTCVDWEMLLGQGKELVSPIAGVVHIWGPSAVVDERAMRQHEVPLCAVAGAKACCEKQNAHRHLGFSRIVL